MMNDAPSTGLEVTHLESLQGRLAEADRQRPSNSKTFELILFKRQHTLLRMRPETKHGRPHFHIEYKREFSASYAIDSLERLAGYMPPKYEEHILTWAATHIRELQATWHQLQKGGERS